MNYSLEIVRKCKKVVEQEYVKCIEDTSINQCLFSKTLALTFCLHDEKSKNKVKEVCEVREPPP